MSKTKPTSVDIDALLAENRKRPAGPKCTVCAALAGSPDPTRTKLQAALDDPVNFSAKGLGKVFTGLGYPMGPSPVDRHRRAECMVRRNG